MVEGLDKPVGWHLDAYEVSCCPFCRGVGGHPIRESSK